MQQCGHDGLASQTDVAYNDLSHCDRVEDIWFARASSDALVRFICKIEGLLDHVQLFLVVTSLASGLFQIGIVTCNDFVVCLCEFRYLSHNLI